ncbi:MAG TPA: tetratricopeptide repeat protein [Burkholderiales bacterium]|nr:tetratricopeptide repeat protein [Burkholderiales bacterium]
MSKSGRGAVRAGLKAAAVFFALVSPGWAQTHIELALKEGTSAYLRGDYRDAAKIIESAVGDVRPGDASATSDVFGQLASLYWMQGRYVEAESAIRRAIKALEALHGPDHPEVAGELSKLGRVLRMQGRYAEAETALWRATRLLEPAYGVDHAYVGDCLNSLGELSLLQGRYAEAEKRYWRAYMIRSYLHGPESSPVGESLAGLAAVYAAMGRSADSKVFYARALAIAEKPPRASGTWGRLDGRDLLSMHAVEREQVAFRGKIYTRDGGPQHPEFALRFDSMGDLYRALGRYVEAATMYERAIALRKRAFGAQHPEVAQSVAHIAAAQADQGQYAAAAETLRSALEVMAARIASYSSERARWRPAFLQQVALLARSGAGRATEESFVALQYANLAAGSERPLSTSDARSLLRPGEALVSYATLDGEAYAAIVRPEGVEVRRLDASSGLAQLRSQLSDVQRPLLVADKEIQAPGFVRLPSVGALRR